MSKPWDPRLASGGYSGSRPRGRRGGPSIGNRHRRRRPGRLRAGDLGGMIAGGIFLGLLLAWNPPIPTGWPSGGAAEAGDPRLVSVIDGDTFDYGRWRIRIADIDTPERSGECAYEIELAARATRRVAELLRAGPFELRPGGDGRDEDPYGRKLRIVTRGGRSLGAVLVAEGLARPWTGQRGPWCDGG